MLECEQCHAPTTRVVYRRPEVRARSVLVLKALLLLAGILALGQAVQLVLTVSEVSQLTDELWKVFIDAPEPGEEAIRDVVRIAGNTVAITILAATAALVYVIVRYVLLVFRHVDRAHPSTLGAIRRVAWLQLIVAGSTFLITMIVFAELETFTVQPSLGINFALAPAILWVTRRPDIREWFSEFAITRI